MNSEQLIDLIKSNRSNTSKFSLIGQSVKRGEFSWIDSLISAPSIEEKIFLYLNSQTSPPKCFCGKLLNFKGYSRGYTTFCSVSCSRKHCAPKTVLAFKEKHGVASPFQLPDSLQRQKDSMKLKKGIPLSKEVKKARIKSLINNYGVENVSQLPEVRDRISKTMHDRYGNYYIASKFAHEITHKRWLDRKLKLLKDVYETELLESFTSTKSHYEALCLQCSESFKLSLMNGSISRCPKCYFNPASRSLKERELSQWVNDLGLKVLTNIKSKELIWPLSLDIWIPDLKIAIEFNGDYWHREESVGMNYHREKLERCLEKGISLIQIFEHEYDFKKIQVLSRLKTILGKNSIKLNARDGEIKPISTKEEREFLEKYHLQGYVSSNKAIGLFIENKLVQVATIGKPRFNKKYDWELLRLCSISDTNIRGGSAKLFKYLKKCISGTMISYRDRRWGTSNFYLQLEFEQLESSNPSYVYSKNGVILSRYAAQKKKLPKLLGIKFNSALTESENMTLSRFNKLWDCGQEVYKYNFKFKGLDND